MAILIQNGTLILPEGPKIGDLRVENGKISEIGVNLAVENCSLIDATDKLIFPGFIDTHTHLEMNKGLANETADAWESGTRAALAGGTTCVLDFSEAPRGGSLKEALETWHRRADGVASCHYGFHMTLKEWNPKVAAELKDMYASGISSFKIYMAYDNLRVDDATAMKILEGVALDGGIVGCHCEDGDMVTRGIAEQIALGNLSPAGHPLSRPPHVEAVAVERWLNLAKRVGTPVNIVHLSTAEGLQAVRTARKNGQALYVETCPQYLLLDDSKYNLPDFESAKFVLSPPLRDKENVSELWQGIAEGQIDTIGTDHCSFHFKGCKELGRGDFSKIPNGMPGVEHRPTLLYTAGVASGKMSVSTLCDLLSTAPAKLFGMYPKKGVLMQGSDADIVIFDPKIKKHITADEQYQAVDYTPYEGVEICGAVDTVLLDGAVAVRAGKVVSEKKGRFIHRTAPTFWR